MNEPEDDFAAMLDASFRAKPLARGQTVDGTIVRIGSDVALVDVGGKSEAVIDVAELKDAGGAFEVAVGDRIQATVMSTAGGITLSRRLARKAATDRQIEEAFRAGLPVEGTVQQVVKGGYEVRVGHSRAFCPFSQIDTARTADPAAHVGRAYTFRIVEYAESGRNIVLSRRALIEEEQQAMAGEIRRRAVPGAVLTGRVVSVRDFGAFVDLGAGVQGLLHVSEMGWSRVADTSQAVAAGDEVTVMVLRVDEGSDRIALGMKQLTDDPWTTASANYAVGQVTPARVTRHAQFGVFVELEPGVEALVPASTMPPGTGRDEWARALPVGSTATVEILSVDAPGRRIRAAHKAAEDIEETAAVREYTERAREESARALGSLADKLRGAWTPKDRG